MTGWRERQKAKRHTHILSAAGALFKRDGFAMTSIEGIAAEPSAQDENTDGEDKLKGCTHRTPAWPALSRRQMELKKGCPK